MFSRTVVDPRIGGGKSDMWLFLVVEKSGIFPEPSGWSPLPERNPDVVRTNEVDGFEVSAGNSFTGISEQSLVMRCLVASLESRRLFLLSCGGSVFSFFRTAVSFFRISRIALRVPRRPSSAPLPLLSGLSSRSLRALGLQVGVSPR